MIVRLKHAVRSALDRIVAVLPGEYARGALRSTRPLGLSPETMVMAYLQGLFPMGQPDGRVEWHTLEERGVIGVGGVHVSKRLRTYLRKDALEVRFNQRFDDVLAGCADRDETWINKPLIGAYQQLHATGVAHSVEAYQDGELVGGGFGLAIGTVFFLDSMYCRVDHASKVAFVRLAERLEQDGFEWIDCQYLSEHWRRFGAKPMLREDLVRRAVAGLTRQQGAWSAASSVDFEKASALASVP